MQESGSDAESEGTDLAPDNEADLDDEEDEEQDDEYMQRLANEARKLKAWHSYRNLVICHKLDTLLQTFVCSTRQHQKLGTSWLFFFIFASGYCLVICLIMFLK